MCTADGARSSPLPRHHRRQPAAETAACSALLPSSLSLSSTAALPPLLLLCLLHTLVLPTCAAADIGFFGVKKSTRSMRRAPKVMRARVSSELCSYVQGLTESYMSVTGVRIVTDCVDDVLEDAEETAFAITFSMETEIGEAWGANSHLRKLPIVVGSVALIYNIPLVDRLTLDRDMVGRIFSGKVRTLNETHLSDLKVPLVVVVPDWPDDVTAIVLAAIRSFGHPVEAENPRLWPDMPSNFVRVNGSVKRVVDATPYSIGATWLDGPHTLESAKPVSIVNRMGAVTSPSRENRRESMQAQGFKLVMRSSMEVDLVDGVGYPLTRLGYLMLDDTHPDTCETLEFALWVLTSFLPSLGSDPLPSRADQDRLRSSLLPLSALPDNYKTAVLQHLWLSACDHRVRRFGVNVTTVSGVVEPILSKGYQFAKASAFEAIMHTEASSMAPQESTFQLYAYTHACNLDRGWTQRQNEIMFPVGMQRSAIVANIGTPTVAVDLEWEALVRLLTKPAERKWGLFSSRSVHLKESMNITWARSNNDCPQTKMLVRRIGMVSRDSSPVAVAAAVESLQMTNVSAETEWEVGAYVSGTVGSMAIVSLHVAKAFGLTVVRPVREDAQGRPVAAEPTDENAARVWQRIFLGYSPEMGLDIDGAVEDPTLYPFFVVQYLAVPKVVPESYEHLPAGTQLPLETSWLQGVENITGRLAYGTSALQLNPAVKLHTSVEQSRARRPSRAFYCDPLPVLFLEWVYRTELVPTNHNPLVQMQLARALRSIHCGKRPFFVTEDSESGSYPLVPVFCILPLVVLLLAYVAYHWHMARRRYLSTFGVTAIAAELEEALRLLDFTKLAKLRDLPNPDRLQRAMLSMSLLLEELARYVPRRIPAAVAKHVGGAGAAAAAGCGGGGDGNGGGSGGAATGGGGGGGGGGPCSPTSAGAAAGATAAAAAAGTAGATSWASVPSSVMTPGQRQVGVLCVRTPPSAVPPGEANVVAFVDAAMQAIEAVGGGMVHSVLEDRILGTWGCTGSAVSREPVLHAMAAILQNPVLPCPATAGGARPSMGADFGKAACGSFGTSCGKKGFHILGHVVLDAEHLATVASLSRAPSLLYADKVARLADPAAAAAAADGGGPFLFSPFFPVASHSGASVGTPTSVFYGRAAGRGLAARVSLVSETLALLTGERASRDIATALAGLETGCAGLPPVRESDAGAHALLLWLTHTVSCDIFAKLDMPIILEAGTSGALFTTQGSVVARRSSSAHHLQLHNPLDPEAGQLKLSKSKTSSSQAGSTDEQLAPSAVGSGGFSKHYTTSLDLSIQSTEDVVKVEHVALAAPAPAGPGTTADAAGVADVMTALPDDAEDDVNDGEAAADGAVSPGGVAVAVEGGGGNDDDDYDDEREATEAVCAAEEQEVEVEEQGDAALGTPPDTPNDDEQFQSVPSWRSEVSHELHLPHEAPSVGFLEGSVIVV